MRIISALIAVMALFGLFMPKTALADETKNANETNINTKIQENISKISTIKNILSGSPDFLLLTANNDNNVQPENIEKSAEETKEEAITQTENKEEGSYFSNKAFIANVSAYTAAADECGKSDGITASGEKVKENHTLACPKQYAFGTKIKIEGYGTYTCKDRGGAIKNNKFDIYMETKKQAFAFGRRNLKAEVVN